MSKYHKLLALVIVLVIAAGVIVWKRPMREGLDIAGGVRVVLQAKPGYLPKEPDKRDEKMQSVLKVIRSRAGGFQGVTEPVVHLQGTDRVVVELPGVLDPEKAVSDLRQTASLDFYYMRSVETERRAGRWKMEHPTTTDEGFIFTGPGGQEIDSKKDPEAVLLKVVNARDPVKNPDGVKPLLTGADLVPNATSDLDTQEGPIIRIQFNRRGTKIFREFTRAHIGEILAIFYDGKLVTAPVIKDAIPNGQAQISGFKSVAEAQDKAETLNSGALPVPLDILAKTKVDATLGRNTVDQVRTAGLVGLLIVVLFMLLYYRLPGFLADVALTIYAVLTFAVFKAIGVTMSLPAIAGFILSIGMAVDANILIFERLKEELSSGKTLRASIDAGFSRAFSAIFDSNMCTAITSVILMWYGTGAVQSFATTLILGVAISMFTAITVTRTFLHLLVSMEWAQDAKWFGLGTSWVAKSGRQINIVGKRYYYYILSLMFILPGIFFLTTSGLKPGIEFKSGTQITATFNRNVTAGQVEGVVTDAGAKDTAVQISEGKTAIITTGLLPADKKNHPNDQKTLDKVVNQLNSKIGMMKDAKGKPAVSTDEVGPTISKELTRNAFIAVIMASVAIVLYLSFRFAIGGFLQGTKFGVAAIMALIHDVLVVTGLFAIFGYLMHWEIDSLFVTAVLTIIGFSVHDTIVVFDRIRENLKNRVRGEDFAGIANKSVLQTFARSINTSLTVLITLGALLALGGPTLKHFYLALFIGIVSGTYSSIFNATPILVDWERLASGGRAAPQRRVEEKPLVTGERAKNLKPIAGSNGSGSTETPAQKKPVTPSGDRVKVKPKKKKKRF